MRRAWKASASTSVSSSPFRWLITKAIIFFSSLRNAASSLQTLVLCHNIWENTSSLMTLDFPHLRLLTLNFVHAIDILETMSFWRRHPNLERVELGGSRIDSWFSGSIEPGFLPKLKHLRVSMTRLCFLHFKFVSLIYRLPTKTSGLLCLFYISLLPFPYTRLLMLLCALSFKLDYQVFKV